MRQRTGFHVLLGVALLMTTSMVSAIADEKADKCGGETVTMMGTAGDDVLVGTAGDDVIHGGAGDDEISGLDGNDILCGGKGKDVLNGGKGKDTLLGQGGGDTLRGGGGNDTLAGGGGRDKLFGQGGGDELVGGPKPDVLKGGGGNDSLYGDINDKKIIGGAGTDTCDDEDDRSRVATIEGCESGSLVGGGGGEFDTTAQGQENKVLDSPGGFQVELIGGGPVDASYLGAGFEGFGSVEPSLKVNVSTNYAPNTFTVIVTAEGTRADPRGSARAPALTISPGSGAENVEHDVEGKVTGATPGQSYRVEIRRVFDDGSKGQWVGGSNGFIGPDGTAEFTENIDGRSGEKMEFIVYVGSGTQNPTNIATFTFLSTFSSCNVGLLAHSPSGMWYASGPNGSTASLTFGPAHSEAGNWRFWATCHRPTALYLTSWSLLTVGD